MPEGDTIHKIANFLAPRLASQVVRDFEVAPRFATRPVSGRSVRDVVARGKHLFIEFDDDTALRSHLGMHGSWHFYGHGETWRKPESQASVVLVTDDTVYVCFNAKEVEWVKTPSVRERVLDMRLGPDLLDADTRVASVIRRARDFLEADTPIIDVLLDQRVASGIGNVYKSEILFLRRHLPMTALAAISDSDLAGCYEVGKTLLAKNLGGGRRTTRFEKDDAGRLWVYGRGGSACFECDSAVEFARLGRHHRSTYWCSSCQD